MIFYSLLFTLGYWLFFFFPSVSSIYPLWILVIFSWTEMLKSELLLEESFLLSRMIPLSKRSKKYLVMVLTGLCRSGEQHLMDGLVKGRQVVFENRFNEESRLLHGVWAHLSPALDPALVPPWYHLLPHLEPIAPGTAFPRSVLYRVGDCILRVFENQRMARFNLCLVK